MLTTSRTSPKAMALARELSPAERCIGLAMMTIPARESVAIAMPAIRGAAPASSSETGSRFIRQPKAKAIARTPRYTRNMRARFESRRVSPRGAALERAGGEFGMNAMKATAETSMNMPLTANTAV